MTSPPNDTKALVTSLLPSALPPDTVRWRSWLQATETLSSQLKHTGPELVYVAGVEGGRQERSWSTGLRQCQSWSSWLFLLPGLALCMLTTLSPARISLCNGKDGCQELPVSIIMACESKEDRPLPICASNPQISGKDSDWPCSSDDHQFPSVQFSRSVVSISLRPHGLQHARPPYHQLPEFTQTHVH